MKKYAFIKNNAVENIVLIETDTPQGSSFLAAQQALWEAVVDVETRPEASVGWLFNSETSELSPPPVVEASTEAPVRHISVGAFFDRFGVQKWAILADTNPAVQALVKDCSVRKYIDLDREDLPAALGLLTSVGHTIDATEILTAPAQPGELP